MPTSIERRNYSLLDSELCMFGSNLTSTMTRDLSDLANFGITALAVTNLHSLVDSFEVFPTDDSLIGDVMIATQDKNAKLEIVKEIIRTMAVRVAMKWGENSGQYRKLGIAGLNNFSEDKMLVTARSVHHTMTGFLSDLTPFGLTSGLLSDFADAIDAYEDARNEQNDEMNLRDTKKVERINEGNTLYAKIAMYCDVGKRIYANTNSAKYNDYVIYGAGGGGGALTAPTNFAYNFVSNDFSWDTVTNATSYQIEASDNGTDWAEIYADAATIFNYIPSSGVSKHYRVRARNSAGFGDFATELLFTYYDSLSAPSNLTIGLSGAGFPQNIDVGWDAVAGATRYKVYRSIVNVSAAPGTYSYLELAATNSYSEVSVENKRFYYYIIAVNDYLESAASAAIYIDVPVNPT
ncbi:MAG: hypothetical protein NT007_19240 [Candidatus Kapabacteria bacterium]|nr:hypothetical protein [Candidatus Kapabacteria bacterium]